MDNGEATRATVTDRAIGIVGGFEPKGLEWTAMRVDTRFNGSTEDEEQRLCKRVGEPVTDPLQ